MTIKRKPSVLSQTLFWAVISAAFIGPGTVTTASKAGAGYGLSLLWALLFSTVATVFLQEAVARIRIGSGYELGEIIKIKFPLRENVIRWTLFLAIAFGCAAYEAGNLLGAAAGMAILYPGTEFTVLIGIGLISFILLWTGSTKGLARVMGVLVALMGLAYVLVAMRTPIDVPALWKGAFVPGWTEPSAAWLAIALIGTTIVPYNLFLGSGLSRGQSIKEMRSGLIPAVVFGGLISMAILVVGTRVTGTFSFEAMAGALSSGLGDWASNLFAFGLFAAGITSAVTAPFAAAMTARILLKTDHKPYEKSTREFRTVWIVVLVVGLFFALTGIKPIPVIIAAQAINGLLLPFVTWLIWVILKDCQLLGDASNKPLQQLVLTIIFLVTLGLGLYNIYRALL